MDYEGLAYGISDPIKRRAKLRVLRAFQEYTQAYPGEDLNLNYKGTDGSIGERLVEALLPKSASQRIVSTTSQTKGTTKMMDKKAYMGMMKYAVSMDDVTGFAKGHVGNLAGAGAGAVLGGGAGYGISAVLGADRTARILSAVGGALAGGVGGWYGGGAIEDALSNKVTPAVTTPRGMTQEELAAEAAAQGVTVDEYMAALGATGVLGTAAAGTGVYQYLKGRADYKKALEADLAAPGSTRLYQDVTNAIAKGKRGAKRLMAKIKYKMPHRAANRGLMLSTGEGVLKSIPGMMKRI